MRTWTLSVLAAAAFLGPATAEGQSSYCGSEPPPAAKSREHFFDDEMNYTVIAKDGSRILMAEGGIGDKEGSRLAAAIDQAGSVDEVWLSSPGGNLDQGEEMGRILRKHGLMVRVPQGIACISACTIAFLGGQIRAVDPGGFYGIHMFSIFFDDDNAARAKAGLIKDLVAAEKIRPGASSEMFQKEMMDLERSTAQGAGRLARYLVEMSASLDFLTGMFGQTQLGVCYVNRAGLIRYNISNTD